MPSTPTSKSQVQAYRFLLRRTESALVRKDAVLVHDPISSYNRSIIVGILAAMVISIGFILFAVFSPSGSLPSGNAIVIGKQSGAVYALVSESNQQRLIPTFNVASARLILMAKQSGQNQQGQQPANTANQVVTPTVVDDDVLKGVSTDRRTGLVDAPQLLPAPNQRISNNWAVCDTLHIATNEPNQVTGQVDTSVLAGVPDLGTALSPNQAILAGNSNIGYYLIYRRSKFTTQRSLLNADVVKAKVNLNDSAVTSVYGLSASSARPITPALLNAILEVSPLTTPTISQLNQDSPFAAQTRGTARNAKIGGILHTTDPDRTEHFYVLLTTGKHEVSAAAAAVLVYANAVQGQRYDVIPNDITDIPTDNTSQPFDDFPAAQLNMVDRSDNPTSCLTWSYPNNVQHTTLTISHAQNAPVPTGKTAITLGQPSPDGEKVKFFYMPTGQAAVVRDSTSDADATTGPIYVISDLGVRFGVPSSDVAQGLGLGDPSTYPPAPDAIVRLLPTGSSLDPSAATRTFDTVPIPSSAGSYPTSTSAQPG